MILGFSSQRKFQPTPINHDNLKDIYNAEWIDLLNPTVDEEAMVEKALNLEIPTREEMQEIELSSRLYRDNNAIYMTVTMVAKSDSNYPATDAVTLVLSQDKLISIRYTEPYAFTVFISRLNKAAATLTNAHALFLELLDASIDRLADILEKVIHSLDTYSQDIFRADLKNKLSTTPDYRQHLKAIAANGDLTTKVQESLISFNRLITFYTQTSTLNHELHGRLNILATDINSLTDHVHFLSTKINFLLDATLGLVNIEQNNIIKIFSIAAVILLPPTLVASIYGMNFSHIPELTWRWGYPFALVLMVISGWLPYKYFKMKKWL